jgi:hypothetical protein
MFQTNPEKHGRDETSRACEGTALGLRLRLF